MPATLTPPPAPTRYVLLTRDEVKAILKCGDSRYYELIGCGALKSVNHGRSRRVRSDHLQEYLDSLTGGNLE